MVRTACLIASLVACAGLLSAPQSWAQPWVSYDEPSPASGYRLTILAQGLDRPWGMDWLPNGDLLITERSGQLRLMQEGRLLPQPVSGTPEVYASGQGGLLDVAVHPDFEQNGLVYLSYSAGNSQSNGTEVARAVLEGTRLRDLEVIFETKPLKQGAAHFGSRLLFLPDGSLLVSVGDGGNPPRELDGDLIRKQAQRLDSRIGKILRITDDGGTPTDNPFLHSPGADEVIWSYGHRNVQGLTLDPVTGQVWASEFGARGGDELNLIEAGKNYGWPTVSYSEEYFGGDVSQHRTLPNMEDPRLVWMGQASPSGLSGYSGAAIPAWRGNLFSAELGTGDLRRILLDPAGQVTGEERIPIGERVRHVAEGPDGHLYLITDSSRGQLMRIDPAG